MSKKKVSKKKNWPLKSFRVMVEKRMYTSGVVGVKARTADEADLMVSAKIASGELQTSDVLWDDPQYEDCSFQTTGDVDEG